MNTTTTAKITKSDLIAVLVTAGKGSPRKLRDHRFADLQVMVALVEAEAAQVEQAAQDAADETSPEAVEIAGTDPILANAFYTVAEIAEMVGLTKFAVRRWVRLGYLVNANSPQVTRKGQFSVLGSDLAGFLAKRQSA